MRCTATARPPQRRSPTAAASPSCRRRTRPRPLSASGGFNKVGIMSGQWLRQAMTLSRHGAHRGGVRARRAPGTRGRLRCGRDPHGARLPAQPVPLAAVQPPQRCLRRGRARAGALPALVLRRVLDAVGGQTWLWPARSASPRAARGGNGAAHGCGDRAGPGARRRAPPGAERRPQHRVNHHHVRLLVPQGKPHPHRQSARRHWRCFCSS